MGKSIAGSVTVIVLTGCDVCCVITSDDPASVTTDTLTPPGAPRTSHCPVNSFVNHLLTSGFSWKIFCKNNRRKICFEACSAFNYNRP